MSYATGSTVKLVRTNSLTSVKDLARVFASEDQNKVTVQGGMRKYLTTTVHNVTKAVGEVTGVGHSIVLTKKKFALSQPKLTDIGITVPTAAVPSALIPPTAPSAEASGEEALLNSSTATDPPSLDCSTSTGAEEVFHNMSSEAEKSSMDESKETGKRPHSASPVTLAKQTTVQKKKKGVIRSASNSPYESENEAADNKLLHEKIQQLEEELCRIKMTTLKNSNSINTNIESIESVNQAVLGMQNDVFGIKEGVTELKEGLVEALQGNQVTSDKVDRLASELQIKLDKELKILSSKITENERMAVDTKNTMAIMERALKEQRAGDNLTGPSRSAMGIYLSGIESLRQLVGDNADDDPVAVVKKMLYQSHMYYFYDRIILGDRQKNRLDTRTALIFFRSVQNKKEAEVSIKRYLATVKAKGVMIRDIFPSERMKEVGGLNKCGFDMKIEGKIDRFRIQNRRDVPILQGIYPGKSFYEDIHPDEYSDALETAMELDRQENEGRQQRQEKDREDQATNSAGGKGDQDRQRPIINSVVPPNNSYGTIQSVIAATFDANQKRIAEAAAGGARTKTAAPTGAGGGAVLQTRGSGGGGGPGDNSNNHPTASFRMNGGSSGHNSGRGRGGGAWGNGGPNYDNRRSIPMKNRFDQLGNNSDSDGNAQENFPIYSSNDRWQQAKNKNSGKNSYNYRKQKAGAGYM